MGAFARDGDHVFSDVIFVCFGVPFRLGHRIRAKVLACLLRRVVGRTGSYESVADAVAIRVREGGSVHFLYDAPCLYFAFSNGGGLNCFVPIDDDRCASVFRPLLFRWLYEVLRVGDAASRVPNRFSVNETVAGRGASYRIMVQVVGMFDRRSNAQFADQNVLFKGTAICRSVVGDGTFALRDFRRGVIDQPGNDFQREVDPRAVLVNSRGGFGVRLTAGGTGVTRRFEVGLRFLR